MAKRQGNAPKQAETRRYTGGDGEPCEWEAIPAENLHAVICRVAAVGAAVRFGYSRSGDAYAIGILGDGDPYTVYANTADECVKRLEELFAAFEA